MGLVTKAAVRLTPVAPAHRTLLLAFPTVNAAGATVSAIVAEGVRAAALELMDQPVARAVESVLHAGLPIEAAAILLVEVEGEEDVAVRCAADVVTIAEDHVSEAPRLATDEARAGAVVAGSQGCVRRARDDRTELLPP